MHPERVQRSSMSHPAVEVRWIKRLASLWVFVAAAVGTAIPVRVATLGGNVVWWAWVLLIAVGLVPGIAAGRRFAQKERDVALPTPLAAGVVAFIVGLGSPFVFLALWFLIWLATGHRPE
jgi:hypothetical protein